uniref:Ribosomal protein S8 n=1 Tax=Toxarium undulatum TaxID=210620 RepID=A0A2U9GI56_9STRA|nr:ribosomal protein S8 [Toxarium undulatum]AWQ64114.1 ribosomal protein S8 [Toxarium undulatum]
MAYKKIIFQRRDKYCAPILNLLWDEGYISGYRINASTFSIFLKYKTNKPVITSIKLITKPGHVFSYSLNQLWKVKPKFGLIIVSTSKGVLSLEECRRYKVGGKPLIVLR